MAVNIIYICDKCGKSWNANNQEEQICSVGYNVTIGSDKLHSGVPITQQNWCRTCVMKTGLYRPISTKDREVAPAVTPTFEEIFTQLLESIGVSFSE